MFAGRLTPRGESCDSQCMDIDTTAHPLVTVTAELADLYEQERLIVARQSGAREALDAADNDLRLLRHRIGEARVRRDQIENHHRRTGL